MTIDLIKVSPTGYSAVVIIEKANRIGQNGNNIIAIIGKQKQIKLMFHLKFTWIGKLCNWKIKSLLSPNLSERKKCFTTSANC